MNVEGANHARTQESTTRKRDRLMPTPTTGDPLPADELTEPTRRVRQAETLAEGAPSSYPRGPVAAMADRSFASLAGETEILRRRRLLAAAICLAATFCVLIVWVFVSDNPGTLTVEGSRVSLRVGLIGLRSMLAVAVAGLLASGLPLSRKQLRAVEYVLFLGTTLLLMASQYFVGLDLMHRGPEYLPIVLAFIKDGVIQMLALMMIYGTLIPNPPSVAARVLVAMFVGPVATVFLLEAASLGCPDRGAAQQGRGSRFEHSVPGDRNGARDLQLVPSERPAHPTPRSPQVRPVQARPKAGRRRYGRGLPRRARTAQAPLRAQADQARGGADPIALARFEREVQSAARLAHPNTIEIYDYGHTDDGTFYYVMEYLQGLSLSDLVQQAGPLPPGRMIYIFRQVCAGLAEAHGLGLVHRDLKPANVFVAVRGGESDVAKVLDFGLVKLTKDPAAAELTGDMTVSGTPMYMSPEQAVGDRSLDARADIYALGAMMYYAITGQPPFMGDNAFADHDGAWPRPGRSPIEDPARRSRRPRASDPALPGQEARGSVHQCRSPGRGTRRLRSRVGLGSREIPSMVG